MSKVLVISEDTEKKAAPLRDVFIEAKKGKRHLTQDEIDILNKNLNISSDPEWKNVYVSDHFNPEQIRNSHFAGTVILGEIQNVKLKYHDLCIETGIVNSYLEDCIIKDNVAVKNCRYLVNYIISDNVILFNIQEMMTTLHSKFGNGIIKDGESEDVRIWVEIANENGGRKVLPFESMLPSDAYL